MKLKLLLSTFLLLSLLACSVEKKAAKSFKLGKYQTSIGLYNKILSRNSGNPKANYFVAESYRLSNRIKDSELYYAKAGGAGIDHDSVKFFYAQALKANGKYNEARQELQDLTKNLSNEPFKDRVQTELKGIDYLQKLSEKTSYYKTKNLELLNTPAIEFSPVYLNNELYFTSSRGNGKIYEATGTPFTDLYKVSSRAANVDIATIAPLPQTINGSDVNDGCITFSPDGKTMVFAKGNTGRRKGVNATYDVDLYISRFRNGAWSDPAPININDPLAWDSSPSFSPDGRTLYFASNRKGRGRENAGYGGTDIYSAQMDSRGRFGRIKNLGPEINTAGNEMFPYVAEDAKLYFASDGHPGFGGLDIFYVKRANGKTTIENLGQPVNSNADDFSIFLFRPDRGFFTSNREGGKGDDDIYTFINEDPNLKVVNYYLQGITYTPDTHGKLQILPNTKITMMDEKGELMQDYVTGNDGKFLFRVYENEDYELLAEVDGYLTKRQPYSTRGRGVNPSDLKELITNITLDTTIVLDLIAVDKIFRLENIYFGFDSAIITPKAGKELDKLIQTLTDNPGVSIELSSHTDSVGTYAYNVELSQRRADASVNYLIQGGISPDRLVAKGYGEDKPIARNTNPDGTDNKRGRDMNRRTEFKILKIGVIPKPIEDEEQFDEEKYFKDN